MDITRYHTAYATEGIDGVLLEVVDQALDYAAAQHSAYDNRTLYSFIAELRYAVRNAHLKLEDHE